MDQQAGLAGDDVVVAVAVKDGELRAERHCCYQAIDEAAYGLATSPAEAVDRRGFEVVLHGARKELGAGEETLQLAQVLLVARPREDLHDDRFGCGQPTVEQAAHRDIRR